MGQIEILHSRLVFIPLTINYILCSSGDINGGLSLIYTKRNENPTLNRSHSHNDYSLIYVYIEREYLSEIVRERERGGGRE